MENTKDYIRSVNDKAERRYFTNILQFDEVEENGQRSKNEKVIVGYAAKFNSDSEDFGGWVERIAPGFFDGLTDSDQTVALFNHDMNLVLGRNKVNVSLSVDDTGLRYKITMPDTSTGNDIRELVRSGIINKSSFAFTVKEEKWTKGDPTKGTPAVRTLLKGEALYDVSPVTRPAYEETTVASRSFALIKKEEGIGQIQRSLQEFKFSYNINKQRNFTLNKKYNGN